MRLDSAEGIINPVWICCKSLCDLFGGPIRCGLTNFSKLRDCQAMLPVCLWGIHQSCLKQFDRGVRSSHERRPLQSLSLLPNLALVVRRSRGEAPNTTQHISNTTATARAPAYAPYTHTYMAERAFLKHLLFAIFRGLVMREIAFQKSDSQRAKAREGGSRRGSFIESLKASGVQRGM